MLVMGVVRAHSDDMGFFGGVRNEGMLVFLAECAKEAHSALRIVHVF